MQGGGTRENENDGGSENCMRERRKKLNLVGERLMKSIINRFWTNNKEGNQFGQNSILCCFEEKL